MLKHNFYIMKKGVCVALLLFFNLSLFPVLTSAQSIYVTKPIISSVTPSSVFPGQDFKINSSLYSDFGNSSGMVLVGNQTAIIKSWSNYSITAQIPTGFPPDTYNLAVKIVGVGTSDYAQLKVLPAPIASYLSPNSIVPGVTKACVHGQNFGTAAQNWTTDSKITIGNADIQRASWADDSICFTVPESVNANGLVSININGFNLQSLPFSLTTASSAGSASTNDQLLTKQWYLNKVNIFDAWKLVDEKNTGNVIVAVIDQGIYINHPDLKMNIWINTKETIGNSKDDDNNGYADDIYGWDFISNNGEMTVRGGHGTHVAGIIGAQTNNGIGIAGIAKNIKLMSLIACSDKGCPTSAVTRAIRYAADNGANVINLSLGSKGTTDYSSEYDDAIKYAYNKGLVIVASAGNGDVEGNSGQNLSLIPQSPVCNDGDQNMILGVSAVDDVDNFLPWANYGPCVDVLAPGTNIMSAAVPLYDSGSYYSSEDGTSFSAPIVSGIAALLKSKYPQMSNKEIALRIVKHSKMITNYQQSNNIGTVDAYETLKESYTPDSTNSVINNPIISTPLSMVTVPQKAKFITANATVNARQTPSTVAKIVGSVKKNTKYELIDSTNLSWFKIKLGTNRYGWVMKKLVKITK